MEQLKELAGLLTFCLICITFCLIVLRRYTLRISIAKWFLLHLTEKVENDAADKVVEDELNDKA